MTILDEACSAIRSKSVIRVMYEGESRIVQPHIIWIGNKGDTVVECWQTAGFSSRGKLPCWARYNIEKIAHIEVTADHFPGAQNGFNADRKGEVICSL